METVRDYAEIKMESEVPNAETLAAFEEVEDMKAHPERYKSYTDCAELMEDLLKE